MTKTQTKSKISAKIITSDSFESFVNNFACIIKIKRLKQEGEVIGKVGRIHTVGAWSSNKWCLGWLRVLTLGCCSASSSWSMLIGRIQNLLA